MTKEVREAFRVGIKKGLRMYHNNYRKLHHIPMFRTKAGRMQKSFGEMLENHHYQSKHYPGNWLWDGFEIDYITIGSYTKKK